VNNTKSKIDPKSKAEKWKGRFEQAQTAQEPRFARFEAYYKFLYAVIDSTPAPWRSKVFLPVLAKQVWALAAKFLSLEPGWQARIVEAFEDLDDEGKTGLVERIQSKLAWDYNNLETDESVRDKLFEPLIDTIVTGTGIGEPSWCTKVKRRHRRTEFTEEKAMLTSPKKRLQQRAFRLTILTVLAFLTSIPAQRPQPTFIKRHGLSLLVVSRSTILKLSTTGRALRFTRILIRFARHRSKMLQVLRTNELVTASSTRMKILTLASICVTFISVMR